MEITEKVAYLKGLMEGLGIDDTTKEGKVLRAVTDILDDLALTVCDLEDSLDALSDEVEMIGEDLDELQEDLFDDEEDGCCCDDDDDFDGELYEVKCPTCGDTICVDENMLDEGSMACPGCGEPLEFDFDGILEDCDPDQNDE